ncbi:uncharacterized protein ACNLHF_016240 [Anomaloglossus baeobatrachus]|uniref:uncharacterized protein LOC142304227 n=1 Tax=Anomaloglossus baeobatrachus TaxID=238106 RepID=UPI003F4F72A2
MSLRGGREEEEAAAAVRSPVSSLPERCLAAAFLQGLALVCACTALSDPGWLLVQVEQRSYVYGAAYILHLGFNLTEPGAHQLLHRSGLYLLLLLTICCYITILVGLAAFLLDFVGTKYMGIRALAGILLPPTLHLTTVLSSVAAVALCTYLYVALYDEVHFQLIKSPANTLTLGESYYFAISAWVVSMTATVFSFSYARKYRRVSGTFTAVSNVEETTPLMQESDPPGEYG